MEIKALEAVKKRSRGHYPTSVRLDPEADDVVQTLMDKYKISQSAVICALIRDGARIYGIGV